MKLTYVCIAALCIATALTAFAADPVVVTEIKDNKGGIYKAVELEEGGKFSTIGTIRLRISRRILLG